MSCDLSLVKTYCRLLALVAAIGCMTAPVMAQSSDGADEAIDYGLANKVQPLVGPRKSITVGQVNSLGGFTAFYGSWDIGGGVAAMMINALRETGHFIVLERASINQVLSEQNLNMSGLTTARTGASPGKMLGSQILIIASITEFGSQDSGGGMNVGIVGGPLGRSGSAGLARQHAKGKVAMDIRLIDPSTTEVIDSFTVSEKIKESSVALDIGYDMLSFGTNRFSKTPLGEATRNMVSRAAEHIAASARAVPWTGQVVEADARVVFINAGSQTGIRKGDVFIVQRLMRTFTDPTTGAVLGVHNMSLGTVEVSVVQPKLSYGAFKSTSGEIAKRGDTVEPISRE
jgi:curli biogenesis system outer membrane secretion channel CsgG